MPHDTPFAIAGRPIGPGHPPYVIAELSANHGGDLDRARAIMTASKEAGADAVKLQTYTADTITIDCDRPEFRLADGPWKGRTLHDLYQEAHTPWAFHPDLFAIGAELGLAVFSTPFDPTAVDFLQSLDAPAFKIASFELVDLPLVRKVAATGKPVIMSTGMADLEEIGEAVAAAREAGCYQLALLHCVSGYPAPPEDCNLATIPHLAETFGVTAGLSDHTLGIAVPVAAVALGASLIEKHVTLARSDGGPDAAFSLEPAELAAMVDGVRTAHAALGRVDYALKGSERGNVSVRRSLYAEADGKAGDSLTDDNVRSIRPGHGLAPRHLPSLLGRTALRDIPRGTPLGWDMVEQDSTGAPVAADQQRGS